MIKNNLKKNIIVTIYSGIWLAILIVLISKWNMTISSDASRHFVTYEKIDLKIDTIKDIISLQKINGSALFLFFLDYLKKILKFSESSFKIIQMLITIIFYLSIFIHFYKVKLPLKETVISLILVTNILTPIYIFTVLKFPLAISFINFAYFFKNKKIKFILLLLAYYTHSGTIYIIITYLFVNAINFKKIKLKLLISLIVINYFKENILDIFSGSYFYYKINSYIINSSNTGIGLATTVLVWLTYLFFIYFSFKILSNKKIYYKKQIEELDKIYYIFLLLGIINTVFLFRGLYFLILSFPYLLSNLNKIEEKKYKIVIFLLIILLLGISENRYLLKNIYF